MTNNMQTDALTEAVTNCANPHILVIEDDSSLANFLRKRLEAEAYAVDVANDGEAGYDAINKSRYDLLILDLNLPRLDGVSLLKQVRPIRPRMPVLVLTGRTRVEDRVLSLDTGADDCMLKPFSFFELSARVRALMRRASDNTSRSLRVADLTLDCDEMRVERAGNRLQLTSREFALLECLMRNARRPVTRAMLMDKVWNIPFDPATNLVDVYVKYVRDKVDAGFDTKLIRTVRGVGYVISED
jgi:DNA-binding response OmpR family regulator